MVGVDGSHCGAADEERQLDGWEDEQLLGLATAEGRITVTCNVKDFARIVNEWSAAGTGHSGCLMMVGIDHGELGLILRAIDTALDARPDQEAWHDYAAWGTRTSGA